MLRRPACAAPSTCEPLPAFVALGASAPALRRVPSARTVVRSPANLRSPLAGLAAGLLLAATALCAYYRPFITLPAATDMQSGDGTSDPLIVLSTGGGLWSTGTWAGWGLGNHVTLKWAAAGVVVAKTCPVRCVLTRNQERIPSADLVVMELVNHAKFLGESRAAQTPIAWPVKREDGLPHVVNFFMEPTTHFQNYTTSPSLASHIDSVSSPSRTSALPVTTVCTWGRSEAAYTQAPPAKTGGVAYWNDRGVAPEWRDFVAEFVALMGPRRLHAFSHLANTPLPPQAGPPYTLEARMALTSTYSFQLVTEFAVEEDWVGPEFSQAFLAGTVPIYVGAPNIRAYQPGPHSFINIADFGSPANLAHYVTGFLEDPHRYSSLMAWRAHGLSDTFKTHLGNCVHQAECRLCKMAHAARAKAGRPSSATA